MTDLNRRAHVIAMLELARAALYAAKEHGVSLPRAALDVEEQLRNQRTYLDDDVRRFSSASLVVMTSPPAGDPSA